jgi:hypothetical protein
VDPELKIQTQVFRSDTIFYTGYFMLPFDLTTDNAASAAHTNLQDNVNIRIELKFKEAFPDGTPFLILRVGR